MNDRLALDDLITGDVDHNLDLEQYAEREAESKIRSAIAERGWPYEEVVAVPENARNIERLKKVLTVRIILRLAEKTNAPKPPEHDAP